MGLFAWLTPVLEIVKWGGGELSKWSERRDTIKTAELDAKVATIKAQAELAVYKMKSDIEWDLKWADGATSSWKDEFMMLVFMAPMIAVFIPGLRPFVVDGFEYMKTLHPDFGWWYMAGITIIFSAVFGMKGAAQIMLPGKVTKIAQAFGALEDDIPDEAADEAQKRVSKAPPPSKKLSPPSFDTRGGKD